MRPIIDLNSEDTCNSNRRTFLRRAATTSVFALTPRWLRSQSTAGKLATLYVTDAIEKYAEWPSLQWSAAAARSNGATLEIDSSLEYQPILGFGAALTEASCFLLHSMSAPARHAFLSETYSPLGLNLNVGRSCIGSSDYSRSIYCYDDVADDTNLDHFTLRHDEACVLPTLREIRQINPRLFLMASPWSPPGWMKTYGLTFGGRTTENFIGPYAHSLWDMANESMLGGWMSDQHLDVYSRYITKFLQGYAQAGAPVQAISCQNEVETTQNGRMPACRWSPGLEAAFVRDHLGPSLRARHLETQIWLLDHNYNYYQRVAAQLEDPELARYVDGVAWHGYTGTPDQMSLLHQRKPNVPFHWTEGGPFIDDPNYCRDWTRWAGIFTDALENWCRCVITWNLMLDPKGKPNLGPYTCGGLVTLKEDGSILQSGQCHALRHFSRHLQRDGVRIASIGDASGLRHLAVRNPDGSLAVILTNPGEAMDLRIVHAGRQVSLSLPRDAVATLAW